MDWWCTKNARASGGAAMMKVSAHDFRREVDCIYDDEQYSVRDNGAVLRHPRVGKRPRQTDGKWVFGKPNSQNGYMYISQKRIHRIVATAFHGTPPTPEHVVDHIDTNRQNNRPENLRWITRLENALNNPVTRKKIEFLCGSIEAFLENPSMLNDLEGEPNFKWMRTVTAEEAKNCMVRMSLWAISNNKTKSAATAAIHKSSFGEGVYKPLQRWELKECHAGPVASWAESDECPKEHILTNWSYGNSDPGPPHLETIPDTQSLTPAAVQRRWKTPTEFPRCPTVLGPNALAEYGGALRSGALFSRDRYKECSVVLAQQDGELLSVLVKSMEEHAVKPWAVAKVTIEDGKFVHEGVGTFFDLNGAKKEYYRLLGISLAVDSIDDYC